MNEKFKLRLDIVGKRFGWLLVLEDLGTNTIGGHSQFLCECGCGKKTITTGSRLNTGKTTSCGCKTSMKAKFRSSKQAGSKFGIPGLHK